MDRAAIALAPGIDARHPDGQYSRGAKWFHWLTVLPILVMLLSGLTIRFINDDVKMRFYTLHESLGLLVLTAGTFGNVLRFLPPLVIADDLLDDGLGVLEKAFATTA